MALASLPSDFQAWFRAWITKTYNHDGSDRMIAISDTMEVIPMRLCLVTVGATASFERLIRQVLDEPFLTQLAKHRYTHLLVQYGKDGKDIWNEFQENYPQGCEKLQGIMVGGFDFKPDLWQYMRLAVKRESQELGIIISHAGMVQNHVHRL